MDNQPNDTARVHTTIRMAIPARMRKEARRILTAMISRIKLEEECLSCRLYQDLLERKTFMFEGVWVDDKSHQKHLRSNEFRNVLIVAEMASNPPEIRIGRIASSTGMQNIEDVLERIHLR